MANLQQYPIWIDGYRLDTLAHSIETRSGRFNIPERRGESLVLPGRDGSLYRPNKRWESGLWSLSMWCADTNADGVPGSYEQFMANYEILVALFTRNDGLLHVRKQVKLSPVIEREAYMEVVGAITPDVSGHSHPLAKFSVGLEINGVFWQDLADVVWSQASAVSGTTYNLTPFAGANAPMTELVIEVIGPANNPKLTDVKTGHYVQLNHTLLGTETWVLNASTWSSMISTTNKIGQTQYSGGFSPRLFGLSPGVLSADPQLRFDATGGVTTATTIEVTGRRKYFT